MPSHGVPSGPVTVAGTDERETVVRWWREFAVDQCRGYSPLYERICAAVADEPDLIDLVLNAPWPGRQPNVLLAAVHDLVLRGVDHPLAERYDAGVDAPDAGTLFCDLVRRHRDDVAALLATRRTNTNECGRSAVLLPALRWAAGRIGQPVALLDGGTSAGLNLRLDRYRVDYDDGRSTGPADAPVRISCAVTGDAPIAAEAPAISARIGLDQAPVDLDDPAAVRWLLACVWPDTGRLPRTRAAIELAQREPVELVTGDLVDGLPGAAGRLPHGVPLVVTTSWVLAYLPRRERHRFVEVLAALSAGRPVAWISAEGPGAVDAFADAPDPPDPAAAPAGVELSVLGAMLFADGQATESVVLGRCHPHGASLHWTGPSR
jgi:hypothetical protein